MSATVASPFPAIGHDHAGCVRDALAAAEALCDREGARLTSVRRRVLELVWGSHAPIGAYALLDLLRDEGQRAAPPTVYRALDFLLEHGLVHRVERLNAFVGCSHPAAPHAALLMLCTGCGRAAELEDEAVGQSLRAAAARRGFAIARQTVEIEGVCADCRAPGAAP